jgi:hypothetical protein
MCLVCGTDYECIQSETNKTSYKTSMKLLWDMKPMWNLDAPNSWISSTKQWANFVKSSINEWIISETNIISLTPQWNYCETSSNLIRYLSEILVKICENSWGLTNQIWQIHKQKIGSHKARLPRSYPQNLDFFNPLEGNWPIC